MVPNCNLSFLYMYIFFSKKWFLFQVEIKKNCYWNCPYNRHRQQIKLHPTSWQYPLINYLRFRDFRAFPSLPMVFWGSTIPHFDGTIRAEYHQLLRLWKPFSHDGGPSCIQLPSSLIIKCYNNNDIRENSISGPKPVWSRIVIFISCEDFYLNKI